MLGSDAFAGDAGDHEFEPSADMLVHDYDDEQTLAEEEAMAVAGGEDPQNELNSLQKESDMPLEQLLAMYGYADRGKPPAAASATGTAAATTKGPPPSLLIDRTRPELGSVR